MTASTRSPSSKAEQATSLSISVIVPTRDRPALLRQAVASLTEQTRPPDEILVVDDGSQTPIDVLPGVTLIRQESAGRSAARNAGLRCAQGDLIAFLDDDDCLPPDSLAQRLARLEAQPEIDVVYGRCVPVDAYGQPLAGSLARVNRRHPSGQVFAEIVRANLAPIHAYLFRRRCLDVCAGFDPALSVAEDWDFWIRLATACTFDYLDAVVAHYRIHDAMSSHNNAERAARGGIDVQARAFELPAFAALDGRLQAALFVRHALWRVRVGQAQQARAYCRRALAADVGCHAARVLALSLPAAAWIAPRLIGRGWLRRWLDQRY